MTATSFMTTAEVASVTGVGPVTLHRWVHRGLVSSSIAASGPGSRRGWLQVEAAQACVLALLSRTEEKASGKLTGALGAWWRRFPGSAMAALRQADALIVAPDHVRAVTFEGLPNAVVEPCTIVPLQPIRDTVQL